jgi:pimeloyl-ACP methyl ester carboxylesterase
MPGMDVVRSADGARIAYEREGTGPALVCVGGAFNTRASAALVAAELAGRFAVVRYDRRGRGDSDAGGPYAVAREVEDLAAVVGVAARHAGGGPVAAYGHSSGAALVLEALAAGVPIARAVLYEPPYGTDPGALAEAEAYGREIRELSEAGRFGDAAALFLVRAGAPPEVVEQMRTAPDWADREVLARTLVHEFAILGHEGPTRSLVPSAMLAGLDVPALLVAGGASAPFLQAGARAVAEAMPDARHVVLEGETHNVAPDAIAPLIAGFAHHD